MQAAALLLDEDAVLLLDDDYDDNYDSASESDMSISSASSSSDDSSSTIDVILEGVAIAYNLNREMHARIENPFVVWGQQLMIADLSDSECLNHM